MRKRDYVPREDVAEEYIIPEQRLWLNVIMNAVRDAIGYGAYGRIEEQIIDQQRARIWFERGDKDFREVCSLAGLEPQATQKAAIAYIAHMETAGKRTRRPKTPKALKYVEA